MYQKLIIAFLILLSALPNHGFCQKTNHTGKSASSGHLFIIGGGKKTDKLMHELIAVAGINKDDYVVILPMSSEIPDSSIFSAKAAFNSVGVNHVAGFNFTLNGPVPQTWLDSIVKAKLVFITGGEQSRFMKIVGKGPVYEAIHTAFNHGATIAGTSAGAAVMSKKMITGNEHKHPEYTGRYPTIEPQNIEITEGLGLVTGLIVDQHFIKRQRMNRLLAVVLENPDETCVGIDESTAIVVTGKMFTVAGENQVIVLRNPKKNKKIQDDLLGGKDLKIDILLPGETWKLK